jgi:flagellar hook-length control protein FliK
LLAGRIIDQARDVIASRAAARNITIEASPAHLGPIKVTLQAAGDMVNVTMQLLPDAVRTDPAQTLRAAAAAAGVQLGTVTVDVNTGSGSTGDTDAEADDDTSAVSRPAPILRRSPAAPTAATSGLLI